MSEFFKQVSDSMADTVEAASKGIVRVEGRRRMAATGMMWREGIVVTASHVVRRDNATVVLPDGKPFDATIVGRSRHTDIAVLRIENDLEPMTQAEETPRVGNLALAVARPGRNVQTTLGIISAVGTGKMEGVIQTDVLMYPGYSGGPLIDASGHVLGMNTSGFRHGTSIAIATQAINEVVDQLVKYGRMRQGFLGVGVQPVRLPEGHDQETGLLVSSVEKDSPAEKGNILLGDIIVSVDGEPTKHLDALLSALSGDRIGKEVPVVVIRGGETKTLNVTIGEKM